MVLDNDTRGWIMTCVSGVGMSLAILMRYRLLTPISLRGGFRYNMCRLDNQAYTG